MPEMNSFSFDDPDSKKSRIPESVQKQLAAMLALQRHATDTQQPVYTKQLGLAKLLAGGLGGLFEGITERRESQAQKDYLKDLANPGGVPQPIATPQMQFPDLGGSSEGFVTPNIGPMGDVSGGMDGGSGMSLADLLSPQKMASLPGPAASQGLEGATSRDYYGPVASLSPGIVGHSNNPDDYFRKGPAPQDLGQALDPAPVPQPRAPQPAPMAANPNAPATFAERFDAVYPNGNPAEVGRSPLPDQALRNAPAMSQDMAKQNQIGPNGFAPIHTNMGERGYKNKGDITLRDPQNGDVLGIYPFVSGGRGRGSAPPGEYQIDPNMMRGGPLGDRFAISQNGQPGQAQDPGIPGMTEASTRTLLRIHQSKGDATLGCIGIIGDSRVYQDFKNNLLHVVSASGGEATLKIGSPEATQLAGQMKPVNPQAVPGGIIGPQASSFAPQDNQRMASLNPSAPVAPRPAPPMPQQPAQQPAQQPPMQMAQVQQPQQGPSPQALREWAQRIIANPRASDRERMMALQQMMPDYDQQIVNGQTFVRDKRNPNAGWQQLPGQPLPTERFNTTMSPGGVPAQQSSFSGKIESVPQRENSQSDVRDAMQNWRQFNLPDPNSTNPKDQQWWREFTAKRLGGAGVNVAIDNKSESALETARGTGLGKRLNDIADDGTKAADDLQTIGRLRQLVTSVDPGTKTALLNSLREKTGIALDPKADTVQAANALINYMVPRMRVPGSGTSSDLDVNKFTASLPSLLGTPGGNQIVMDTIEGLAAYRKQRSDIAASWQVGDISAKEANKQMDALPDPFGKFRAFEASKTPQNALQPAPSNPSAAPARINSKQEFDALPSGTRFIDPDGNTRIKP